MTAAIRKGIPVIFVATLVMAVGCYLSWKAGCVFDSKQGIGDARLGQFLSAWALACAILACAISAFCVLVVAGRKSLATIACAVVVACLAVPSSILALLVAESYGASACYQQR